MNEEKERDLLEDIILHPVESKWKEFFREVGKHFAWLIVISAGTIMSAGIIKPEDVAKLYIIMTLVFSSGFIGLLVWYFTKKLNIAQNDILGVAQNHQRNVNELTERMDMNELKTSRWIEGIEEASDYAIYKRAFDGEFLHVNKKFEDLFGLNVHQLNRIFTRKNYAEIFKDDELGIGKMHFTGELIEPGKHEHRLYMIDTDQKVFPAVIKSHIIHENGSSVIQGFIRNVKEIEDMRDTIQAQNDVINKFVKKFAQADTEDQFYDELIDELETLK